MLGKLKKRTRRKIKNAIIKTILGTASIVALFCICALDSDTYLFHYILIGCMCIIIPIACANDWFYPPERR